MRNKLYTLIVFALVVSLGLSSCNDEFLDVTPVSAISADEGLSDPVKVDAFITGMYDKIQYYYYTGYTLMYSDVVAGDVYVKSAGNYNRFPAEYQYTLLATSGNAYSFWLTAYEIIANANQVTSIIPTTDFDEVYKTQVVAEARAIRATAYINLIQIFSHAYSVSASGLGVPIVLEPLSPNDEFPARATVQEVYDVIIADLLAAEADLSDANTDIMRITKNVVQGLLSRVYLNMGDWQNASDYAVLARTGFPLAASADLLTGFVDPTSEWIWSIDMREDDNNGYLMLPSFYDTRVLGYSSFRADEDFYALFEVADARISHFGPYDDANMGYKIEKYLHRSSWDMDQVLMRSAEMYLIEAEAQAELGNAAAALTALNEVQTRAGATLSSGLSGQALIDAVLLERRKELFGEGFRLFDLTRRNLPLVRTSASHWAPISLSANDDKFLMPIPQDEMDANENMVQNDAY